MTLTPRLTKKLTVLKKKLEAVGTTARAIYAATRVSSVKLMILSALVEREMDVDALSKDTAQHWHVVNGQVPKLLKRRLVEEIGLAFRITQKGRTLLGKAERALTPEHRKARRNALDK